jgi:hypothetical protein
MFRDLATRTRILAALVLLAAATASARDTTVAELKARILSVGAGERPKLCLEIAQRQLDEANKLYATSDVDNAQLTLTDAISYSEKARDYAIQSHKYEKQTEIAVRAMTRRLDDILHTLGHEDQSAVHEAIKRLQTVRDDLLKAMFPKGKQ